MASNLLDKIINETTLKFGGRESLVAKVGNEAQSLNYSSQVPSNDQLDLYSSMMQDIEMGQKERIFWILLFSLMVFVAAGGNIVVIHIVSTNKEMKSVTNYFLVNLSLADTMVSTLNVIFNFISMLNSHWPFGNIYCKISNFIAILSISASVFTLTAISCDRYTAIIHPLRPRMSHRHAIGWILLIWTLSSALALPNLIYSVVVEDRLVNENLALTCTMIWPDGRYPLSSYDHIYNIIILVVTYLVPILTMAILYYKVGKELWGHQAIGEDVEKQARAMMAKKKIVKMMIVVVIIFALCWLPYHGFFVVNYYLPTIFQDGPLYYQRCYLIMYWLAMSNSMYNPIIIYFMNSKFRHEFKRVLCFICCCRAYSTPTIKGDSSNHHQNYIGAGGGGNNHSIARLISSNHGPSRRLNGNGGTGQHAVSTVARSGDEHRLGKSVSQQSSSCSSSKRSANQHRQQFNGSIEVVISHPGEVDDVHHHQQDDRVKLDHEREPFIKDPSNASGDNSNNNNNNNNNSNSSSYNTGSGDNFKNDLDSGGRPPLDDSSGTTPARTASGDDMRPTSIGERYHRRQTGQDKVWI